MELACVIGLLVLVVFSEDEREGSIRMSQRWTWPEREPFMRVFGVSQDRERISSSVLSFFWANSFL